MEIDQELITQVKKYWSNNRFGKHKDVIAQHAIILNSTLKVDASDLFEQIYNNKFDVKAFPLVAWSSFLTKAKLAEYLDPTYVNLALDVTTGRPALGKGEFLLVSCFGNLAFEQNAGDLITLDTHEKIELKGMRSTLSGDKQIYKTMNSGVMTSIFSSFPQKQDTDIHDRFSREDGQKLDTMLRALTVQKNNSEKVNAILKNTFKHLQNISNEDNKLAEAATNYYLHSSDKDIFLVTGAMHLCTYMTVEHADYLIVTNNDGFCCYANPAKGASSVSGITEQHIANAVAIFNNNTLSLKLSTWQTRTKGMEISI